MKRTGLHQRISLTPCLGLLLPLATAWILGLLPPSVSPIVGHTVHAAATGSGSNATITIPLAPPRTIYVASDALGANDGTSWADAYTNLQDGLADAQSGDEIWVAAGTYKPTSGTDRTASFQLKNSVALYGGFNGTETNCNQRDWANHPTILSGDIGTPGSANDNTYHVVTGSGTDNTAVLDGFAVTRGNANGSGYPDNCGGGMYNYSGSPTVRNVTFTHNRASDNGGGMYNNNSDPTLTNVTFRNNDGGSGGGGGMYNYSSNPALTNVTFSSNEAWGLGGGMYNYSSSPTLINASFSANGTYMGGGMYNRDSAPALINVTFSGNYGTMRGGGMCNEGSSNPTLTNVTFRNNDGSNGGGGGMYNGASSASTVVNCIFWGNTATDGSQIYDGSGTSTVRYSLVQGGYPGTGNIDADPRFVNAMSGNLRLQADSPAIDAGNNTAVPADAADLDGDADTGESIPLDLDGRPRFFDSPTPDTGNGSPPIVDMGAYEFNDYPVWYVDEEATGSSDGTSWASAFNDLQSALAAAAGGDEIWVAAGTYEPTTGTNRTATFQLKNGVALYGGFRGTETNRDQRDWPNNSTILNGDIGTTGDTSDNSYHVVTGSGTDRTAVLDGFTITGGNANVNDPDDRGGGMINENGAGPTLSNMVVVNNSAALGGGGMYNYDSSPALMNVTFNNNDGYEGGGIHNDGSAPALMNVTFAHNSASFGGGIYNTSSHPTLTNVTFSGNDAYDGGGGMYNDTGSDPAVTNSIFWGNTTMYGSSQIDNQFGTSTVRYSLVQGGYPGTGNIDADPLFEGPKGIAGILSAQDYGLCLRPGSPAIDAGDNAAVPADANDLDGDGNTSEPVPLDLDGHARFIERPTPDTGNGTPPIVDMGAYECEAPYNSRDSAWPIPEGIPLTDIITTTDTAAWYKFDVPAPGSNLTVTLTGLSEDYNLFLFAPAIDESTGQLYDRAIIKDAEFEFEDTEFEFEDTEFEFEDTGPAGNVSDLLDTWQDVRGKPNVCFTENIGQLGNTGQVGGVGSLLCVSSQPTTTNELVALNTHELYGPFYVAVSGHTVDVAGQPYTLTAVVVTPTAQAHFTLTHTVVPTFTNLISDTHVYSDVKTLILFNRARFEETFIEGDIAALSQTLDLLAEHPQVQGRVIHLDEHPEINTAYEVWNDNPDSPYAANLVATQIKLLLYHLVPRHPDLEYLVIVGGDPIIPYRRVRDEALFANERKYAPVAHTLPIAESLASRYFLSDDYYANAGLRPLAWKGRELYLPQLAIGRLVEQPDEIEAAVYTFLSLQEAVIAPTDALVTGYDFLADQAQVISQILVTGQGIATLDALIGDAWTAEHLRARLITPSTGKSRALNSLNAHFSHFALAPASIPTPPTDDDFVWATEVTDITDYNGAVAFSLGCHSGLNVKDADFDSVERATDWPQAFSRQGATFIGNTGYGYGAADLLAYSERLIVNFVEELNYVAEGPQRVGGLPTIGGALLRAKHRYYNTLAAGTFSNYDEKIIGQMTLYGLPMLAVQMPIPTTTDPSENVSVADAGIWTTDRSSANTQAQETINLTLQYQSVSGHNGTYFTLADPRSIDVQVVGARPIEPRLTHNIQVADTIVHGVLMAGGTFTEVTGFDPLISRVITDETYAELAVEPAYDMDQWYPVQTATINRFWRRGAQSRDRLVIVPAQFRPALLDSRPTTGTQRLYTELQLDVYRAPITATDYLAPAIWHVHAISSSFPLRFRVRVDDDDTVARTVVLYRQEGVNTWSSVELTYDPATGWAGGSVPRVDGPIYYFAQAVDPTGNVALALDHGNPFHEMTHVTPIYLPSILKRYVCAPDLVVQHITPTAGNDNVQVVIKNQGNAPATDDFWVDLYVDPNPIPTAVNQIWNDLAAQGVVWDITTDLGISEVITLTIGDAHTSWEHSGFSGPLAADTWIYVQVDSANTLTNYGGVLEYHEITGAPYNNVTGVQLSTPVNLAKVSGSLGSWTLPTNRNEPWPGNRDVTFARFRR